VHLSDSEDASRLFVTSRYPGCAAGRLADLKGKPLAIPSRTREHCLLFLERACRKQGKTMPEFFGKISNPTSVEDALDDAVDGTVGAVLVDGVSLDCYKNRKPARFARLKVVLKSPAFPAAVVAYHSGAVDATTLNRFVQGMLAANRTAFGRQLLTLWKMTGFERVPANYAKSLKSIARIYPAPPMEKVSVQE
jgi:ABC-type phosphate/phosphonate transport system substrate-binding protein